MDHLFIVRIWSEPREGEQHFRGSVEHVGSRLRRHFADPAGLVGYLEARVGEATSDLPERLNTRTETDTDAVI